LILLVASSLRFLGGYSIGFWGAKFFTQRFGDYSDAYSWANMGIVSCVGMFAAYCGGWICDFFSKKWIMTNGLLDGFCVVVAFPFILLSFIISKNFWLSISFYGMHYLFAEMWYGPCVAMLLQLFPAQVAGLCISIFSFCGAMTGAVANTVLGKLNDHYTQDVESTEQKGIIAGRLLTIVVAISYLGCCLPFVLGAYKYRNFIINQRQQIKLA
jgi:sugar phosphate permease